MRRSVLLLVSLSLACERNTNHVHLIVPDGYTGPIIIAEVDGYNGGFERRNGKYVYSIPPSGVLCVSTYAPFLGWHRLTAEYKGGATIYSELSGLPQPPGPEAIRIRAVGQRGYTVHMAGETQAREWPMELWIGLGTEDEVKEIALRKNATEAGFDTGRCGGA